MIFFILITFSTCHNEKTINKTLVNKPSLISNSNYEANVEYRGQQLKYISVHSYYREQFVRYDTVNGKCVSFYKRILICDTTKYHFQIFYNLFIELPNNVVEKKLQNLIKIVDAAHGKELISILRSCTAERPLEPTGPLLSIGTNERENYDLGTGIFPNFKTRKQKYCNEFVNDFYSQYVSKILLKSISSHSYGKITLVEMDESDGYRRFVGTNFDYILISTEKAQILSSPPNYRGVRPMLVMDITENDKCEKKYIDKIH